MFTNRDEVLEKALRIFAKMNYEKASQMEIAKTCGLSKAGLVYYFPFKLDLFKAVVDKYVFDTQHSKNKFNFTANSLSEFIDQYVAGVENMMQRLVHLLDDGNNPSGCSFNFYYYHLLMQVRLYYPNVLLTHCNADVFPYIWALLTQLRRCKYSMTISYYKVKAGIFHTKMQL